MALIYGNKFIETNIDIVLEDRVYFNKDDNISIVVNGDGATNRGFLEDPYYKIHDNTNPGRAKNTARISLRRPEYIIHNNEKWTLNSKQRKKLNDYLRNGKTKEGVPVWDAIKQAAIEESIDKIPSEKDRERLRKEILSLECPDYTKLDYRK